MHNVNLPISFSYVIFSVFLFYCFNKKHYWKILLFSSLLFLLLLIKQGIIILLLLSLFTYYFSLKIKLLQQIRWWMVLIILLPLILKKITSQEHQFDNLTNTLFLKSNIFNVLGLSYITLNALSYLIDIKRNYIEPQKNYLKLLLYLIYFPIIFSGPLTRAKHFFNQIENIYFNQINITNGLRLILWGLFKNLVVSSRLLGILMECINLELKGPIYLLNGFVFYLFLYCSFSSFVSIFQGISLIFNIQINDNFQNRIYLSSSRNNFWKGWHITINQWFRDYLFYELIRFDKKRKKSNVLLFFTFICIALWHDFTFAFLIWGILNATWLISERKIKPYVPKKYQIRSLGIVYHITFASLLATIFISKDISNLTRILTDINHNLYPISILKSFHFYVALFFFLFMDYIENKSKDKRIDVYLSMLNTKNRYFFYYLVTIFILFFSLKHSMINYYNYF